MPLLGARSASRSGLDLPVDLPLDLPIWALTVEMWNYHSLPFLTTRCHYWGGRSVTWSANMSSKSSNVKLLFLTTRCQYQWGGSANWSANMSSNSRNVKLTTRCHYWGVDLPVDLPLDMPLWALSVAMWNYHSGPLDANTGGLICQ